MGGVDLVLRIILSVNLKEIGCTSSFIFLYFSNFNLNYDVGTFRNLQYKI